MKASFVVKVCDNNPNHISAKKRWLMRFMAMMLPLIFLFTIEGVLRILDYGYGSNLFDEITIDNENYLLPNRNFTDRFFPPTMARKPLPIPFQKEKPEDVIRIFLLGESAAYGDPDSSFGMGRFLEAILETRYPEQGFEVINLAITAINSNVILPISQELAQYNADAWMLYMGNNEMVGPYGAGTIFGNKAPSTAYIRTILTLKKLRTVQWLETTILHKLNDDSLSSQKEWDGVNMFTENKLRYNDAAKLRAYQNFEQNIASIFAHAEKKNIPIFVSTVASNLKDCSPFISLHRKDITPDELEQFNTAYQLGSEALHIGHYEQAHAYFNEATRIDDTYAELQFQRAACLLALGDQENALSTYKKARDLDALCIRADSRINDIIRNQVTLSKDYHVFFTDTVKNFERSPFSIPGETHFFEHVHFTMSGNYRVALGFADKIESAFNDTINQKNKRLLSDHEERDLVYRRLAITLFEQFNIWERAQWRIDRHPYKRQSSHQRNMKYMDDKLVQISTYITSQAVQRDEALYKEIQKKFPEDVLIRWNYARFLESRNRLQEAIEQGKIICEKWSHAPYPHYFVGSLLRKEKIYHESEEYLKKALKIDPHFVQAAEELKLNQLLR